ncbi:MAG: hypothetical protein M3Y81_01975 [Chloroflexota bacterium]|nr:hypothetical protein [Chloroflexota bacterium]
MPRSLAHGDYRLLMAVESASRAHSWYRVLRDHHSGQLSCDCPAWTFRQAGGSADTGRSCKHTRIAYLLLNPTGGVNARLAGQPVERASGAAAETHRLVQATRQQWPGLGGRWSFEQRTGTIDNQPYHFVLLHLTTGNGTTATGLVAFARRYHLTTESMVAGVAGWAGYTIAADVARSAGYALAGQPPEHFTVTRRATTADSRSLGLADILRVGDQINLGDGYTPVQRAENTLRLFLGDSLYVQLEQQHFLDVSSVRYASERRVYRVRRDPAKLRDRRVRVFTNGQYVQDLCIVRGQDIPEADHWMTIFLSLLSDEERALSVVQSYNIFPPHSDDYHRREEETIAAVWQAIPA